MEKLTKTLMIASLIGSPMAIAAQNVPLKAAKVSTDTYELAATNSGNKYSITNLWMYDASQENALNYKAQYPQLNAQLLVRDGKLFIPKFKNEKRTAQKFYEFDALTGDKYTNNADNTSLSYRSFMNIGNVVNEDTLYYVPNWNTRFDQYNDDNKKIRCSVAHYKTLSPGTEDQLDRFFMDADVVVNLDNTSVPSSKFVDNVSYYDIKLIKDGDNSYSFYANGLTSKDSYSTSSNDALKTRSGCFVERFDATGICHDSYETNADYSYVVGISGEDFRKKSGSAILPYTKDVYPQYILMNVCGKNAPYLIEKQSKSATLDDQVITQFPIAGENTGDAIAEFSLGEDHFVIYTSYAGDKTIFKVVSFPGYPSSVEGMQTLWDLPNSEGFDTEGCASSNGETITSITVNKTTDEEGVEYADIYVYAQGRSLAAYRMTQSVSTTSVNSVIGSDTDVKWLRNGEILTVSGTQLSNVEIFTVQGAKVIDSASDQVDLSSLANGVYVARCGSSVYKFTK
jgi:hypothetical protein